MIHSTRFYVDILVLLSQGQNIASLSFLPYGNRAWLRDDQYAPKHSLRLVDALTMVAAVHFLALGRYSPVKLKNLGSPNTSS